MDTASDIAEMAPERVRQMERDILGAPAGSSGATGAERSSGQRGVQVHWIKRVPLGFDAFLDEGVA